MFIAFAIQLALSLAAAAAGPQDTAREWYASGRQHVAERVMGAPARNVILFVGDGMGVSTVTAARILDGQLRGESGERNLLSFERFPYLSLVKVYNSNQQVPDSAGTITAMTCGVKTLAGVIGVGPEAVRGDVESARQHGLRSLLEECEERGFRTGVVTTARITHATPAGAYAHVPERNWEHDANLSDAARAAGFPDIAAQLVQFGFGDGIDVVLGGGRLRFLPRSERDPVEPDDGLRKDGRNLIEEWQGRRERRAYVWNREQLLALEPAADEQVLGLFATSHMAYEIERGEGEPSLSEMTAKAIELLASKDERYFLLVEGGRIDHGHHAGNAYRALTETIEFARSVTAAVERVGKDTLILVTADHSHTMTIGGYPTLGNDILGLVVENDAEGSPQKDPAQDMSGKPVTTLGYQNGPGYTGTSNQQPEGPKRFPHRPTVFEGITAGRPDLSQVGTAQPGYLQEAAVPLNSETHGGEDVPLYAVGPGAELVGGVVEQHVVYHVMVRALGFSASKLESSAFGKPADDEQAR